MTVANVVLLPKPNRGAQALLVYLGAYALSLWALSTQPDFSLAEPLFVLAVMGVAFPLLAVTLTRGARNDSAELAQPSRQLATALTYLAIYAIAVLGYGFSAINAALPDEPQQSLAKFVVKLLTMVALPWLLIRCYRPAQALGLRTDFNWRRHGRSLIGVGIALLAFQAVFGRGLQTLGDLHAGAATLAWAIPAGLLWLAIETGLTEEFLFRFFLQTRLAAALKSEFGAICLSSLLFGLAHAPGLYLRGQALMEGAGAHPTMLWAIAYSVAIISPAGLLFGTLWSRTRSLSLIVALHALTDLLPNLAPFIQTWTQH
jgi:membrane protease YdiL (CAAX protease family)